MARFRRRARTTYRAARRAFRSARKPSLSVMDVVLAGAIYGVARPFIAGKLPSMFNFGGIDSDNVILAGAGYFASKQSSKLLKSIGLIAIGTEAGIVTSNVIASRTGATSSQSPVYDY